MDYPFENKGFVTTLSQVMLQKVPSYANKIYYSLGFLSMTSLLVLILSGITMAFFGPTWWLTDSTGVYVRSIHLWATQAFILFIILHLLIVFLTSGFKYPRRLTWVFGATMFFLAMAEAEFGYILRGDYSSQWRSLQASDLYNGSGLGIFINNLNYAQIYGLHIIFIPILILGLLFLHYFLIRMRGIAKPHSDKVSYQMVQANHKVLFLRGGVLVLAIFALAYFFNSPTLTPTTLKDVATQDPSLFAQTLLSEWDRSSGTATYLDSIDPYNYDTMQVYIATPYHQFVQAANIPNSLDQFSSESSSRQDQNLKDAKDFYNQASIDLKAPTGNPVVKVVNSLTLMAQSGLYETSLRGPLSNGLNPTYVTRLLSDTGVLENRAQALGITTDQYGMIKEEAKSPPFGPWWLTPIGLLDHTLLSNDPNQDRDGAEILGLLVLLLVAYPYIPILNRIPEKIVLYKLIWR